MTEREHDASDMLARSPGVVLPATGGTRGEPTPEEFALITQFGDDRIDRKPSDYYAFRMIVSSDGMDSFFTRPDPKTSLVNYGNDLKRGQSLLGSHQTSTFSYGVSYDGELLEADATRHEYEASFFRRFADKTKTVTTKWAVGKYAIPRGMTVNSQSTDDLIRGISFGAIRRVSISFTVGRYMCELDNNDMIAGFFGPEGQGECRHMPGVTYGDDVATALMVDNDLHETSLVFKNSSPSSMFLRKAEVMAQRGMISERDIVRLEERMFTRLPRRTESGVWKLGDYEAPNDKEKEMTDDAQRHTGHMHVGLNVDADDIKGGHGVDYEAESGDEVDDPEAAAEMLAPGILDEMSEKEKPVEDEVEKPAVIVPSRAPSGDADPTPEPEPPEADADQTADAADEDRHAGHQHVGPTKGGHFTKEPEAFKKKTDEEEERMVRSRQMARDVLGRVAAYETRDTEIAGILGERVTVEAVKRLERDAKLGRDLFMAEVDKVIKARIAVDGEAFNAEKMRSLLASSRDLELVQSEAEAWSKRRSETFTAGRQVTPGPLPEKRPATAPRQPDSAGVNIIESLSTKK